MPRCAGNGTATFSVVGLIGPAKLTRSSLALVFPGPNWKGLMMAENKINPNPNPSPERVSRPAAKSVPEPVDPIAGERPAAERQVEQLGSAWPKPGDEGYVHPDGTPQAAAQIKANRQAAADRAAAGSAVHGAPAATPGPQIDAVAAAAIERAEADSGRTDVEREEALTDYVRNAEREAAGRDADDKGKRSVR